VRRLVRSIGNWERCDDNMNGAGGAACGSGMGGGSGSSTQRGGANWRVNFKKERARLIEYAYTITYTKKNARLVYAAA
jgi:hypothetical protein